MKKSLKIIILIILILCVLIPNVKAESIDYFITGEVSKIVLPEGTLKFIDKGIIDELTCVMDNKTYIIECYITGDLSHVSTPSGEIYFSGLGIGDDISSINGDRDTILAEAQTALEYYYKAVEEYFKKINLDIENTQDSNNDLKGIYETLSTVITDYYNNINDFSGIDIIGNTSLGNNSITQDKSENNVDENGVNIGAGGAKVEKDNNIVKYILLGVVFLIAFVLLVFGIIAIKKKNNQIKVVDKNQNSPYNQ